MRRRPGPGALAAGMTSPAVPATADPILTVPLCDLDGHCDKRCEVYAKPAGVSCR